MTNLFDPPDKADLPVTLGADILVTFNNRVPGSVPAEYVDYPPGWAVTLVIGKDSISATAPAMISAPAVITGHSAVCRIESEVADLIKNETLWRVIVSIPDGQLTNDIPAMVGKVVRADGT